MTRTLQQRPVKPDTRPDAPKMPTDWTRRGKADAAGFNLSCKLRQTGSRI